ncbi:MAG: glycosyltransferase family 4 protein [Verrucomicrobiota bacterium]|nr:glycosyltransferase family 4 protein [Verrucomicrobiota bacterium]
MSSSRKRVLYLQHSADLDGGASFSLLEALRRLDRSRYEPLVVAGGDGHLLRAVKMLGIDVFVCSSIRPLLWAAPSENPMTSAHDMLLRVLARQGIRAVRAICAWYRPALVHVNSSVMFHLAAGVDRSSGARVVLHVREHWRMGGSSDRRERFKNDLVANRVDAIVGISETSVRMFGFADRSRVIYSWPNFRDRDGPLELGNVLGLRHRHPVVLDFGGRLAHKGALDSCRAIRRAATPDVVLGIFGGVRARRGRLYELARSLFLAAGRKTYGARMDAFAAEAPQRIRLLPFVCQVKSAIEQAAVVVSPFTFPHFSCPAMEAGALGKPAIVSDGGEAREIVLHGQTGLIVPPGDPAALAQAIDAILSQPELTDLLGRNARQFIRQRFDPDRSMAELHRLYAELAP